MSKRLYRSRTDRVIWGVCGGLAKYFNIDPVIVRIIAVLLIFVNGLGLLAYIIMAIVVPLESSAASEPKEVIKENVEEMKETAVGLGKELQSKFAKEGEEESKVESRFHPGWVVLGIVLIVAGALILLANFNFFWWFQWYYVWTGILVAVGVLLIVAASRKK